MLECKRFESAGVTISGIELVHRIQKEQFDVAVLDSAGLEGSAGCLTIILRMLSRLSSTHCTTTIGRVYHPAPLRFCLMLLSETASDRTRSDITPVHAPGLPARGISH